MIYLRRVSSQKVLVDLLAINAVTIGKVISETRTLMDAQQVTVSQTACVTDEGPGFSPEFLPRAFDRFARAEASRTSDGSGLGLAFAHAVATAHSGTAHADNAGTGTAAPLRLPC